MKNEAIAEIGIDAERQLYVRPTAATFPHIYRAGVQIHWDDKRAALITPAPQNVSYSDWFARLILAVFDEYDTLLVLKPETVFTDIPNAVRDDIKRA
jgi:uncharacterized protein YllA (UPF0747 family)